MRKFFLIISLIFITLSAGAQITATGICKIYQDTYQNIDFLLVFSPIDNNTSIKYTGTYSSINWYKFSDQTTSISNQDENFNVEDATGYILDVDGQKYTIWVIDYSKYMPVFTSLTPEDNPSGQCDELNLELNANVPVMQYQSLTGTTDTIDREFTLTYNTLEWSDAWADKAVTETITLPQTEITVTDAPLCDTKFKITGDQFAQDLGLTQPSIESDLYSAVRVESHIVTTTAVRTETNEADRPSTSDVVSGSAPLDILFESDANTPVAQYYQWQIFKDSTLLFNRTDQDQQYTFEEAGDYVVKLIASNNYCSYADSVTVTVSTSDLQVPPVFTPNGDGVNDEFRVGYKSIVKFKCWVFNRWGRQIFSWTDPQKGWDGTISGRPARPGAYLYVVEATGADGVKYSKKGVVNLLRGKD
ncbi:MAG: gliding motility-associated C-terminal domain-containing protein [Paludibacter sp.]|nr:gliding motility-associated C-terminal domain-containing protein [Paludibacter sp.]